MAKKKTFAQHVAEMEKEAEGVIAERGYNPNPQFMPTYLDNYFKRNDEGLELIRCPIAVKDEVQIREDIEAEEGFVRWLSKSDYDKCSEEIGKHFVRVMEERLAATNRMEELSPETK